MVDESNPVNKAKDSLSSPLFESANSEDEGTLVTATYKEPMSPSSPLRVLHAFDTVQAVGESRAVSENIQSAQREDKAMTLRSGRSEGSRPPGEKTASAHSEPAEQQPRYLRVGALHKWSNTGIEQEAGMERGMLKESCKGEQVALDKDRETQIEAEQEDVAAAPKRLKMLQAEEQLKPRATYFALTGQMQDPFSPSDAATSTGVFDDFSVRSAGGSSQGKVLPPRRNPSLHGAFEKTSQAEAMMMRNQMSQREMRPALDAHAEEMMEIEKKKELKKETERHMAKMKELERERKKHLEMEKEKLLEFERMKEREMRELERQKQKAFEKEKQDFEEKQRALERQKQTELEKQKLQELERERLEKERQQHLERELRLREQERKRQREQERQRQREEERQRELDRERQLLELQKEKQKMEELERIKELERQQLLEFQKQKQKEKERQQLLELEKQVLREKREREEVEKMKQMALEQEMLRIKELDKERERQRELERQRQRVLERERQKQLDLERQEIENQRLRQREQEKERQRKEEFERIKEMERRQLLEFEKLKQAERDRQQITELEKRRLREKMEKEEAERASQIAKQQEAERQRLKEKQRKEEQERAQLEASPLRPQVVDLDSVIRYDPFSKATPQRSDPATRWREPSLRTEESYKPSILDLDSFTSPAQVSSNRDLFSVSGIQGLDTGFGARLQPTPEREISWKVPTQTSLGFKSSVWTTSPQDPWELQSVEMSVDKPTPEPSKQTNKLRPEQLLLRHEERPTPLRPWSAVLDEQLRLAPFPTAEATTGGSSGGVFSSTAAEQIWLPRETQDSRGEIRSHRTSQGSQVSPRES